MCARRTCGSGAGRTVASPRRWWRSSSAARAGAPALARALRAEVELHFEERYPPVRIVFGDRLVLVEDGPGVAPDLQVDGSLPDLISLMVAPLVRGVPSPIDARGRAALGMVALGRVRIEGRLGLMRKFLSLIRV